MTADDALRLQHTAGNRAVSRMVATLARRPVSEGGGYCDSEYRDVKLERVPPRCWKIKGGPKDGLIIYFDDDDYYEVADPTAKYPEPSIPFDISTASAVGAMPQGPRTMFDNLGEKGKGVSNVTEDTTLHTSGLNTCIGWYLFNNESGYLAHILVNATDPAKVLPDGIQDQVDALYAQFVQEAGKPPTGLTIKVDGGQPGYSKRTIGVGELAWMTKLTPSGMAPATVDISGGGSWHKVIVKVRNGAPRKEWDGAPIKLKYATS